MNLSQAILNEDVRAWYNLPDDELFQWLRDCFNDSRQKGRFNQTVNKTVFIDGCYIYSKHSFLCELGEQLFGIGGYFGSDLDGLSDCCSGGIYPIEHLEIKWFSFYQTLSGFDNLSDLASILDILSYYTTNFKISR